MSYLPFAITAFFLNAVAVTIDKFLLTKIVPNPFSYIFYISLLSLLTLLALPFTHIPTLSVFILTSVSTLLWTIGAYLMFWGIKIGQVSRVIPVIGTLTPLFLLIYSWQSITITQVWAVVILILGLIFVTLENWFGKINKKEIIFEFLASIFFAISYIFLKEAYFKENFITVLVWGRWVLVPLVIVAFFFRPQKRISLNKLMLVGQSLGATSQLLLTFSISLATPALVNSIQGVQFVFLFIFGLFLGEKTRGIYWVTKILGIILISLGLFLLTTS